MKYLHGDHNTKHSIYKTQYIKTQYIQNTVYKKTVTVGITLLKLVHYGKVFVQTVFY